MKEESVNGDILAYKAIDNNAAQTVRAIVARLNSLNAARGMSLNYGIERFLLDQRFSTPTSARPTYDYNRFAEFLQEDGETRKRNGDTFAEEVINESLKLKVLADSLNSVGRICEERYALNKNSLVDFTRKSVVGAIYRVGASFTMDALYLTAAGALAYLAHDKSTFDSVTTAASDFFRNLDAAKLFRVAAFVVGINFADYKWDITNKLDKSTRKLLEKNRKN